MSSHLDPSCCIYGTFVAICGLGVKGTQSMLSISSDKRSVVFKTRPLSNLNNFILFFSKIYCRFAEQTEKWLQQSNWWKDEGKLSHFVLTPFRKEHMLYLCFCKLFGQGYTILLITSYGSYLNAIFSIFSWN